MDETAAAAKAAPLVSALDPACVAMCGLCTGRRNEVFLGDVIVVDRVYSYDLSDMEAAAIGYVAERGERSEDRGARSGASVSTALDPPSGHASLPKPPRSCKTAP